MLYMLYVLNVCVQSLTQSLMRCWRVVPMTTQWRKPSSASIDRPQSLQLNQTNAHQLSWILPLYVDFSWLTSGVRWMLTMIGCLITTVMVIDWLTWQMLVAYVLVSLKSDKRVWHFDGQLVRSPGHSIQGPAKPKTPQPGTTLILEGKKVESRQWGHQWGTSWTITSVWPLGL